MKSQYRFFIIFMLLPLFIKAQFLGRFSKNSDEFKGKFASFLDNDEKIIRSWYHYVVTQKGNEYILRQFYPEKMYLTSKSSFLDKKLKNMTGKSFESNGSKGFYCEGTYIDNLREGEWNYYDSSNVRIYKFYYINGKQNGEQFAWFSNGKLKFKEVYFNGVKTGKCYNYFNNGKIENELNYLEGVMNDNQVYYDSTGKVLREEIFKNGKRIFPGDEFVVEEKNAEYIDGCELISNEDDRKSCGMKQLGRFLQKNLKYPQIAQKYEMAGRVFLSFIVDRDGKISEVEVVKGLCESMDQEAKRVLELMPNWKPATQNGKPVRSKFNLPISFLLE